MPNKRKKDMINAELLKILACPVCKKGVREEGNEIVCTDCGRRYPVRDGIPVMLAEEAKEGKNT